jgi:hypothetical protein
MGLEQIQAELRAVSGKPYRFPADADRRRELWRRLDEELRRRCGKGEATAYESSERSSKHEQRTSQ